MMQYEKRIKIAEVCPFVEKHGKAELVWRWQGRLVYFDPFYDLNAMHEAEKLLRPAKPYPRADGWEKWDAYRKLLADLCGDECGTHATATQCAEAFGITLKLWE